LKKAKNLIVILFSLLMVSLPAQETAGGSLDPAMEGLRQVQQYGFAISILAMLLVGFGFLMVFVRNHGYGATAGTFLVVAVGLPTYLFLRSTGVISSEAFAADSIASLLFAEFAVASALIAMGAVLGRLKVYQYGLIALLLVPAYMLNEKFVLDGALGITKGFVDAAGSVSIHAFGAYFGIGLAIALTRKEHMAMRVPSDATSDRFSMLGSMVLWLFWPSFCSAIVPAAQFQITVINTVMALCGATVLTYITTSIIGKGKATIADIANASLAGGVAIGATCNIVTPWVALLIGALAGTLCVVGYWVVQPALRKLLKVVDTCGVHNLHGMPGILGGLVAAFAVPSAARAEIAGIAITVAFAFTAGTISGFIIRATGKKAEAYEDKDEFLAME